MPWRWDTKTVMGDESQQCLSHRQLTNNQSDCETLEGHSANCKAWRSVNSSWGGQDTLWLQLSSGALEEALMFSNPGDFIMMSSWLKPTQFLLIQFNGSPEIRFSSLIYGKCSVWYFWSLTVRMPLPSFSPPVHLCFTRSRIYGFDAFIHLC